MIPDYIDRLYLMGDHTIFGPMYDFRREWVNHRERVRYGKLMPLSADSISHTSRWLNSSVSNYDNSHRVEITTFSDMCDAFSSSVEYGVWEFYLKTKWSYILGLICTEEWVYADFPPIDWTYVSSYIKKLKVKRQSKGLK